MIIYNTTFSQSTEAQSVSLVWKLAGNWAVRTFLPGRSKIIWGRVKLAHAGDANHHDCGGLDSLCATAQSKTNYLKTLEV